MDQEKVLNTIQQYPNGISNTDLCAVLNLSSQTELVQYINSLLTSNLIEINNGPSGILYRPIAPELANILAALDQNERLLYSHIREAGNKGIWIKDLSFSSGLSKNIIPKILKRLENKAYIKNVRSVKNPGKKMYMLSELEPSIELSGGAWFTDNELDVSFVNILSKAALKYIFDMTKVSERGAVLPSAFRYPTAKDVCNFVNSKGVTSVEMGQEDLSELLEMLVDDRQLERVMMGAEVGYKCDARSTILRDLLQMDDTGTWTDLPEESSQFLTTLNALVEIPCGKCPVARECSEIGPITPKTCVYFKEWLSQ